MTEFLNELSENQINYLKQQKKHKYIVGISRILILFSFLFLKSVGTVPTLVRLFSNGFTPLGRLPIEIKSPTLSFNI